MDGYVITNNEKDRISSSELFSDFKSKNMGTKMTASKFKEDMKNISGVTTKKISLVYYCGLRIRDGADFQEDE